VRIAFSAWLLITVVVSQTACVKPEPSVRVYSMGERVQVGPLVYNVMEADWRPKMGEGEQARIPSHRFLTVHLSVTNGGGEALSIPSLKLLDDNGRTYDESIDGQNVPSWLGLIRKLKPVDTLEGNILFDVEPKSYKLKLNDDADAGQPALVEMPLRFELEKPVIPSALGTPAR